MSSNRSWLKFVVGPLEGATAQIAALGLVVGQGVGGHVLGVVDAADDDRPVGVALLEGDDHLLADPRDVDDAPLLARPESGDPDPARAVGVFLALAIPGELDLDPAVLVGEDLVSRVADHDGCVWPLDGRSGSRLGRSERQGGGDALKRVLVERRGVGTPRVSIAHGGKVGNLRQDVGTIRVEVPVECELAAGRELTAGALSRNGNRGSGLLLHPDADRAGVVLEDVLDVAGPVAAARGDAVEPLRVAAGKVVELERVITGDLELVADGTGLHRVERRLDRLKVLARQLKALVPERVLAGSDFLALRPATDAILLSEPSFDHLVDGRRRARHVGVAHGRVGDDHLVAAVGVGEDSSKSLLPP